MQNEKAYTNKVNAEHIKAYGQYFTQPCVAEFMCSWAGKNAANLLDPAAGNSIFLTQAKKLYPDCKLTGYEIDEVILDYFQNPAGAELFHADYLLNDWQTKYDAIVCNPPYNRFQAIPNRNEIIEMISAKTGIQYSNYTNLYILFLIKSIHQLSDTGRLAYIIPTEFFNSKYGTPIKELMLKNRLIRTVINFKNNDEMFFNATTTCCILLLEKNESDYISFYNLVSADELKVLADAPDSLPSVRLNYSDIKAGEKWRAYLNQETSSIYENLTSISKYCKISRGIATGANLFFCLSKSKIEKYQIPPQAICECICRSADVKKSIFTRQDFLSLSDGDKTVYLLDIQCKMDDNLNHYIQMGEEQKINQKHLLSRRSPWYSMEQKMVAPIWVTSACRDGLKFIRNLAGVKALTTFHSIFIKEEYTEYVDILFCYFLTPVAQSIIRRNRKELGNGLEKFQPGDLKDAQMLDIALLSPNDVASVKQIYSEMLTEQTPEQIERLNDIFSAYLITV